MKVLITGASGQLGRTLLANVPPDWAVTGLGSAALNISDSAQLARKLDELEPIALINCAAYTDVNGAESDEATALLINGQAPGLIGRLCRERGVWPIHLSTDFVFDGDASAPYPEDAVPNPLNVYGRSKLAGERAIQEANPEDASVLRTAWVYSAMGRNFVLTIRRLLRERDEVSVVDDERGSPTSCLSLSRCLWAMLANGVGRGALLHWVDAGVCSRFELAHAIRADLAVRMPGAALARLRAVKVSAMPSPARRPTYSALQSSAALCAIQRQATWTESLQETLAGVAD